MKRNLQESQAIVSNKKAKNETTIKCGECGGVKW
jgi:hypothetical protein